uniref:microtubule-severing ATPase n=2 Tax=Meloidogyne incognita group TaxID=654580 RepID=A0A915N689_MELJA
MSSSSSRPPVNEDVAYANYTLFQKRSEKARESLRKALEADETRANKKGVILLYKSAMRDFESALSTRLSSCPPYKHAEIRQQQEKLGNFLESVKDRLTKLEEDELSKSGNETNTREVMISRSVSRSARGMPTATTSAPSSSMTNSKLLKGVNSKFGEEILSTILADSERITLRNVEGNEAAKEALEESVILPSLNPKLFTGLRAPCKGILLFGPPGNGKTMIAKALASECHSTFFNVSAASIMSKWVGDGEKMVQALFQVARNAQPSIIFIDEVDSMLCERSEQENGAARRVKTEFLIQMDGCANKSEDRILVLGATNRPNELDEGILRRFPKRIFIDLPEKQARASMIKSTFHRSNTQASLSDHELNYIAELTAGYSYSDLDALCRSAALIPLRSVDRSNVHKFTAAHLRPVNLQDFEAALTAVKPSLNKENRKKLLEFARRHAQMTE